MHTVCIIQNQHIEPSYEAHLFIQMGKDIKSSSSSGYKDATSYHEKSCS